jgi:hypothetical protein
MNLSRLLQLAARCLHRQNSAESVWRIPQNLCSTGWYSANLAQEQTGVQEEEAVQGQVPGTTNEMVLCVAPGRDRNRIRLRQISTPRLRRQQAASKMGCCFRRPNCHPHRKNTPSSRSRQSFDRHNPWPASHRLHTTNRSIHILVNRFRVRCLDAPRVENPWCRRARQDMSPRNFHRDQTNQQQARPEFPPHAVGQNTMKRLRYQQDPSARLQKRPHPKAQRRPPEARASDVNALMQSMEADGSRCGATRCLLVPGGLVPEWVRDPTGPRTKAADRTEPHLP